MRRDSPRRKSVERNPPAPLSAPGGSLLWFIRRRHSARLIGEVSECRPWAGIRPGRPSGAPNSIPLPGYGSAGNRPQTEKLDGKHRENLRGKERDPLQYNDTVRNKAVQEVLGAIHYYRVSDGWVVTTSTFSRNAVDRAEMTGIQLIDGSRLLESRSVTKRFQKMLKAEHLPAHRFHDLRLTAATLLVVLSTSKRCKQS